MSFSIESLSKTLVVGASVSAAPVEKNPAKRFLREHGFLNGAFTHAFSGHPGAKVLGQLRKSMLDGVSAVIAVDLMFWDSVFGLGDPLESKAFLRGFLNEVKSRGLPIILGNIPRFHDLQVHRDDLNEAIAKEVGRYEKARLLELDRLFLEVSKSGLEFQGRRYSLRELLPDGLHPSPAAAEGIAREIKKLVPGLATA